MIICKSFWPTQSSGRGFAVMGDAAHLQRFADAKSVPIRRITDLRDHSTQALCVIDHPLDHRPKPGTPDARSAMRIIEWIEAGVRLVQNGQARGIVTNPINKKLLVDGAGFAYPGHTEFLAALDGKASSVMMLSAGDLRVVPVTVHVALRQVPDMLTREMIVETAKTAAIDLHNRLGIRSPRVAMAGLNPHAGEGGLMGDEELRVLIPAFNDLKALGLRIEGPMSADTMFHQEARAGYDFALCMYHDQALIPLKTIGFDEGVNSTLGLSFVRTSPDHGTAYGIAGQGVAKSRSLEAALDLALEMSAHS